MKLQFENNSSIDLVFRFFANEWRILTIFFFD